MDIKVLDRAWDLAHMDDFDFKTIRRVRTPSGERRYKQPIGSIIVRDAVLDKIKIKEPVWDGWDLVEGPKGKEYDVGYDEDAGKWIATEHGKWDKVVVSSDNEEDVFRDLNKKLGGTAKVKPNTRKVSEGKKVTAGLPKGFEAHTMDDGQGRTILRGKDADGREFRGYQAANGRWIAYYKDEQGWTKSREPSRTPGAAIRAMAEQNDTMPKSSRNRGTFTGGTNSRTSSNPKTKPKSAIEYGETERERRQIERLTPAQKRKYARLRHDGKRHDDAINESTGSSGTPKGSGTRSGGTGRGEGGRRTPAKPTRRSGSGTTDNKPSRAERMAARNKQNAKDFPVGSKVTTTVHSIGGRSEEVTGKVIGHEHGAIIVRTPNHGDLSVERSKARKG